MADYIERANLLDGITSPEFGLDEIIDELIYEHNLDFLHDNNEDAVREFAKDLIGSIKNYIKTEPIADVVEVPCRCNKCRHCEIVIDQFDNDWYFCTKSANNAEVKADHFCGYGERRDT